MRCVWTDWRGRSASAGARASTSSTSNESRESPSATSMTFEWVRWLHEDVLDVQRGVLLVYSRCFVSYHCSLTYRERRRASLQAARGRHSRLAGPQHLQLEKEPSSLLMTDAQLHSVRSSSAAAAYPARCLQVTLRMLPSRVLKTPGLLSYSLQRRRLVSSPPRPQRSMQQRFPPPHLRCPTALVAQTQSRPAMQHHRYS